MEVMRAIFITKLLLVFSIIFCGQSHANDSPQPGDKYIVLKPLYLMATYNDLNVRQLNNKHAKAYLHTTQYYNKAEVAFQRTVPTGTTMTIVSTAPKVWRIPFFADRYFIHLDPDLSDGLDVILELNRGVEGSLDGLSPDLFDRR